MENHLYEEEISAAVSALRILQNGIETTTGDAPMGVWLESKVESEIQLLVKKVYIDLEVGFLVLSRNKENGIFCICSMCSAFDEILPIAAGFGDILTAIKCADSFVKIEEVN